jgi:adenosyl cobinamide kinase/adenosyl cobinamide phosphate guanylyltransferase
VIKPNRYIRLQVWLGNWMGKLGYPEGEQIDEEAIKYAALLDETARKEIQTFIDRVESMGITVLIVSNECGLGMTPSHKISRYYRDTLGRINQDIARRASKVFFMIAGCAVDIKLLDAQATLLA